MDWRRFAPVEELPYLLVTQIEVVHCDSLGFASEEEEGMIRNTFGAIDSILSLYTYSESVGTLTHNCLVREYFYLQDTIGLNRKLKEQSQDQNWNYKLLRDESWKGYLEFLYPDAFLIQTMVNSKAIAKMKMTGSDPSVKRLITHSAGFSAEDDRNSFSKVLKERGFKILDRNYNNEDLQPYQITFSRTDQLEITWISEITMHLAENADKYNGQYGGWEIEL